MTELNTVNNKLTAGIQTGTTSKEATVALRRARGRLEEKLEDLAEEQNTLQGQLRAASSSSTGSSCINSNNMERENNLKSQLYTTNTTTTTCSNSNVVVDLCEEQKTHTPYAAYNNNGTTATTAYTIPSTGGSNSNTSTTSATANNYNTNYSVNYNIHSSSGNTSGIGSMHTSQISPQLATMQRLAGSNTSSTTPIAMRGVTATGAGSGGSMEQLRTYTTTTTNNDYNNTTYTYNTNTSNNSSNYMNNNIPTTSSSNTYNHYTNNNTTNNIGYTSHSLNPPNHNNIHPTTTITTTNNTIKTSKFNEGDFDSDFEDAVNNNDFTDWMGGEELEDRDMGNNGSWDNGNPTYQSFGNNNSNTSNNMGNNSYYNNTTTNNNYNDNYNYNTTNNNNYIELIPQCQCGDISILCTSRQPDSNGQKFYCCAKQRDDSLRCKFFQWEDPTFQLNQQNTHLNPGFISKEMNKDHIIEIRQRFGHIGFRYGQKECIEAALEGRDVFCLMPTGGGKSVVYQVSV